MSWQILLDPARPTWPGVLVRNADGDGFDVLAGKPYNFADSLKLAERLVQGLQKAVEPSVSP